jgi:predicted O-methyltransferase YrrM
MNRPQNTIPTAELRQLFPGIGGNQPLVVNSSPLAMGGVEMPLLLPYEQLVLAAIVRYRKPRRLLEFGTAQGHSTFSFAANSPPDATVYTLDLHPEAWSDYTEKCLLGDVGVGLAFRDTPEATKIRQLLRNADAELPDELTRHRGGFDYIHVDADHGYAGVKADTLAALDLAAPTAVITWHDFYDFPDYIAQGRVRRGVYPWLNELQATGRIVLRHILGTYLVVGCPGWTETVPGRLRQPGESQTDFGMRIVRLGDSHQANSR